MSKTTIETLHDDQIRTLRREASSFGDTLQVAICDLALGAWDWRFDADALGSPDVSARLAELGYNPNAPAACQEKARVECARVIADAEAQS